MSGILDGKAAIVTGSGRGIGRAAAGLLAGHGASVLVTDIDAEVAKAAAAEIGGSAVAFAGDLTDPAVPGQVVQTAVDAFGTIDIVVNNAGYAWDSIFHKMTDEQFMAMLEIHTIAPFRLLRAAAPILREAAKKEQAEGREVFRKVVNVTSVSGTMGGVGQANYSSAKAAVVGLTKTLAKEWGPLKINVNAVAFGFVETRMTAPDDEAEVLERNGKQIHIGIPRQSRERAATAIPIGRPATPEEAAGGIFLLCTPWANFIQGQVVTVSGGMMGGMTS
ncbi:MAG TPA: SDR family NAD(P)-dependent oxidoreductase [Acidimicrobiales bacterium]|nr:SDR family NAD(P)-dependent oxidoreductase [Acidimicrobiales bacterium]